jgi:hypothetical protein
MVLLNILIFLLEFAHVQIIKGESRELIQKVKKSTLQQFKCDNDGKNIQSMNGNEASLYFEPIVDACISKFMSSCKGKFRILSTYFTSHLYHRTEVDLFTDEEVFDSKTLTRVCGEVEKKLQSYTAKLVKVRFVDSFQKF